MSVKHPIVAITGSSGAGTSTVTKSFDLVFRREKLNAAIVEGDSFHRYDRKAMKAAAEEARLAGNPIRRIGHERWLRNLAVGLGNAPASPAVLAALRARADDASPLQDGHLQAGAGQIVCAGQAIVPAADDQDIAHRFL